MQNTKKKQIIAVDIDDVLAATAQGWVAFSNATWGTNLTIDDYDEDWSKAWKVDYEESDIRRDRVFRSGVFGKHDRMEGAEQILRKLTEKYRLIIVTSRVELIRKETLAWLDIYFPGLFDTVRFSGFYDKASSDESVNATKADLLKEMSADYFIDDQLKHCLAAADVGIKTLLFGDYRWNQAENLPNWIRRVKDWAAVLQYFDEQS